MKNSIQFNSTSILCKVVLSLFVLIFCASCAEKSTREVNQEQFLTEKQAMVVAIDYVHLLADSTYELRLTADKSAELGIAPKDYERMKNDISQSNKFLKEMLDRGVNVDIVDPQSEKSKAKRDSVVSEKTSVFSRSTPSGGSLTVRTGGQGEGRGAFNTTPNTDPNIKVNCWASGIMQVFKVWAMTCATTSSAGGVGPFGAWDCTLSMACTNTTCAVGFQTANSNGGSGTFTYTSINKN